MRPGPWPRRRDGQTALQPARPRPQRRSQLCWRGRCPGSPRPGHGRHARADRRRTGQTRHARRSVCSGAAFTPHRRRARAAPSARPRDRRQADQGHDPLRHRIAGSRRLARGHRTRRAQPRRPERPGRHRRSRRSAIGPLPDHASGRGSQRRHALVSRSAASPAPTFSKPFTRRSPGRIVAHGRRPRRMATATCVTSTRSSACATSRSSPPAPTQPKQQQSNYRSQPNPGAAQEDTMGTDARTAAAARARPGAESHDARRGSLRAAPADSRSSSASRRLRVAGFQEILVDSIRDTPMGEARSLTSASSPLSPPTCPRDCSTTCARPRSRCGQASP